MPVAVSKMCQTGGFLLLVSMLFFACSVWSYFPGDPTWNHYVSHGQDVVRNLGGAVGAVLADWGLQMLGSTILLLTTVGALGAWYLMRRRIRQTVAVAWRGLVLLAAVSTATQLIFRSDPLFGSEVLAGGISGRWLAQISVKYLHPFGAYVVLCTAATLVLFVGVDHFPRFGRGQRSLARTGGWAGGWLQHVRGGLARLACVAPWVTTRVQRLRGEGWRFSAWHLFRSVRPALFAAPMQAVSPSASWATPPLAGGEVGEEVRTPRPRADREPASEPAAAVPSRRKAGRRRQGSAGLPSLDLFEASDSTQHGVRQEVLEEQARFLEQKLRDFGVQGEVVQVLPGPVITMYEYAPASGVKVNKIVNLQDDLALVMRAVSVRVVAPVPGKGVVGIEIPNKHRETVRLRDILGSDAVGASTSKLSLALGKDILGTPCVTDLALIPHLLIAGATGSGKSVGLNSMICSLLFRAAPTEVKFIMIDPKMLELSIYEGIPHLLIPVVTNPKQAALALRRVVGEMERRYQLLAARGVRSIAQFNQMIEKEATRQPDGERRDTEVAETPLVAEKLPYLVVVIDELSDLMMVASREVEESLTRIAQMARAAGIHLIVATQRPSVDVLTGVIKANFPARLSFQVTSKTDSRTILDANGAERLLGQGDMLFLAPGTSRLQRMHSAYVSEAEINRLVAAWKELEQPLYDDSFLLPGEESADVEDQEYDEKYDEAVALVARMGQASISMLQRRLRVGYNRAARMIEIMEKEGVIGPADGVKPREVLVRQAGGEV